MLHFLWLIPVGAAVGLFGTVVGAGGGFILMPLLLLLYPEEPPEVITNISLCVVCLNALSGSASYARMGRVHYRAGIVFIVAGIPGAALGALATYYISRSVLDLGCGALLFSSGLYLLWRPNKDDDSHDDAIQAKDHSTARGQLIQGGALSCAVGFLSSLLGIGGGIIHVPVLVHLLDFPVHIATATSHFVLAGMSFTGVAVHVVSGAFTKGMRRVLCLGIGVVVGAQLGAQVSSRLRGVWIMRALAIALSVLGARLLWQGVTTH